MPMTTNHWKFEFITADIVNLQDDTRKFIHTISKVLVNWIAQDKNLEKGTGEKSCLVESCTQGINYYLRAKLANYLRRCASCQLRLSLADCRPFIWPLLSPHSLSPDLRIMRHSQFKESRNLQLWSCRALLANLAYSTDSTQISFTLPQPHSP